MPYFPGDFLVICDICGFRKLRSQTRKNWKGQIVCADTCYEPKHPLLSVKPVRESIRVPDARPVGTEVTLSPGDVTVNDL